MKIKALFITLFILLVASFGLAQETKPKVEMKKDILKVGEVAPDFALSDQNGKQVKLSKAVKKSPVLLVFYRGFW